MKYKKCLIFTGVLFVVAIGFYFAPLWDSDRKFLVNSQQFTLFSLSPHRVGTIAGEKFGPYQVLGKLEIKDASLKAALISALFRSISEASSEAGCHNPRHGIRAIKDGRIIEVSICFECHNAFFSAKGNSRRDVRHETLSRSAEPLFNKTLADSGIPLSPD